MSKNDRTRKKLFVSYYLGEARFNGTEASLMAGYKGKDRHSQNSIASGLLNDPEVKEMLEKKVEAVGVTQDEILAEYAKLIRWDHTKLPVLDGMEANAHAKVYDTQFRAKLTAMNTIVKLSTNGLKEQIEKLKSAFEKHRNDYPEVTDAERVVLFKEHVDPTLVEEMFRELMMKAENRRRLIEVEAVVSEPMDEEVDG